MVTVLEIVYIAFGIVVTVFLSLLWAFSIYLHFFVHRKYKLLPGPPRQSFFLGNIPSISKYYENGKIFSDAITDWTTEYGPILVIYLLHQAMIVANSAESVKEFLVTSKHPKAKMYDGVGIVYGHRLMGRGLITERNHEIWLKKRAVCDPAFHRKELRKAMFQFNACADLLIEKLSTKADGKTEVVMLDELNRITLDAIAKIGFGLDLDLLYQTESKFNKAAVTVLDAMDYDSQHPWDRYNPLPASRRYRKEVGEACKLLRETGEECVRKRLQAKARGDSLPDDVMTMMMEAGERFENGTGEVDLVHILDEFASFFIAGSETTANTLAFAFVNIYQNDEIIHRLITELDAVTGDHTDVEFEDLAKLTYASAVIKETLRMYPPADGTVREAAFDTTVHGHTIPKGSTVLISPYTMGRLENNFKDPIIFEPDRFLRKEEILPNTYFPFSIGPRSCIGKQFALIEAKVLVVKLLKTFEFELVPDQSFQIRQEGTLKPMDGCKVFIKQRN